MKKISISILLAITIFFMPMYIDVFAWPLDDFLNRNACNTQNYELAYANPGYQVSTRSCHSTYQEAKNVMNSLNGGDNDNLVIFERKDNKTYLIDAKYGFVDYDMVGSETSNLYKGIGTSAYSYVSGAYSDDAVLIDFRYSDNRKDRWARIKVSGLDSWIKLADDKHEKRYDILPLVWVKDISHYEVTKDSIKHVLPADMYGLDPTHTLTIGPKPNSLAVGKYYSYDGIYFYSDPRTMINDYKAGAISHSVNANSPYYNYYVYLPHRTKSLYTSDDINSYVKNVMGYKSKIINGQVTSSSSMLYEEGKSFVDSQEKFGTNALLMFSVAVNESGRGRSALSYQKNNIFGHTAYDSDPFASGSQYPSISAAIQSHASRWLSLGYLNPIDYRYYGSNVGNKASGVNVKYASDAYWGEKAAANYYQFEYSFGFQDYNFYRLGVLTVNTTVYPKTAINGSTIDGGKYKISTINSPIVIVGEEQGTAVNGNTKWYKIMSDPALDSNYKFIDKSQAASHNYNWQGYAYVPAAYFTVINPEVAIHDPNEIGNGDTFNPNDPGTKYVETNPGNGLQVTTNNLYYFESLKESNGAIEVSGFLAIAGMNNGIKDKVSHQIIIRNVDTNKEYIYSLKRWITNIPFNMTNSGDRFDYGGAWFKGRLDLSNLPQGNYRAYVQVINGSTKSEIQFNNLFYKDMTRKAQLSNGKGIKFSMNYLEKGIPMEVEVRDAGLLSNQNPPTTDEMFNSFQKIEFIGDKLHIRGTSHNVGIDYSPATNVKRQIVLENINNFTRYSFEAGAITNGDYTITLRASDGKDKTKGWFDTNIDLTKLPKGVYAIYVVTESNGFKDYGELNDLLYTDVNKKTTIGSNKVSLRRVDGKRFRIELVIE